MANFSLNIDSKFRPLTYDELIKPFMMYKEGYDAAEKDYTNLVTQAEAFKDVADRENNPEAYEIYSKYSDDLQDAANDLYSNGYTSSIGSKLMKLKGRYAGEITAIGNAANALKEANAYRDKAGADAIFRKGRYTTIDDFLHGKVADNSYISRSDLTKRTAALTSQVMQSAMKEDPEFKKVLGDKFYLMTQHSGGVDYDTLKQVLANDPTVQNKLTEVRDQMLKGSDYLSYDFEGGKQLMSAINEGLYAGLDTTAQTLKDNPDYLNPAQRQAMYIAGEELKMKKEDNKPVYFGKEGEGDNAKDTYYDPAKGLFFTKDDRGNRVYTGKTIPGSGSSSDSSSRSPSRGSSKSNITGVTQATERVKIKIEEQRDGSYKSSEIARGGKDDEDVNTAGGDKLSAEEINRLPTGVKQKLSKWIGNHYDGDTALYDVCDMGDGEYIVVPRNPKNIRENSNTSDDTGNDDI